MARENGFILTDQGAFLDSFTEAYLDAIASYAGNSGETTTNFVASNTFGLLDEFLVNAATSNSRVEMLNDWTLSVGGVRRLNTSTQPDLAPVTAAVDTDVRNHIAAYRFTRSLVS